MDILPARCSARGENACQYVCTLCWRRSVIRKGGEGKAKGGIAGKKEKAIRTKPLP